MRTPIQLTLTLEEINQLLKALGKEPFAEVEGLVERIRKQTFAQMQQSQQTPDPSDHDTHSNPINPPQTT